MPLATLAAILLFIASRLVRVNDLKAIAHFSKVELGLAAVTAWSSPSSGSSRELRLRSCSRCSTGRRTAPGHATGRARPGAGHHELGTDARVRASASRFPACGSCSSPDRSTSPTPASSGRASNSLVVTRPHLPKRSVLDAAAMGDIDYTGATTLREVVDDLMARKIKLAVASAGRMVIENLKESGILDESDESGIFETVDEAVRSVAAGVARCGTVQLRAVTLRLLRRRRLRTRPASNGDPEHSAFCRQADQDKIFRKEPECGRKSCEPD